MFSINHPATEDGPAGSHGDAWRQLRDCSLERRFRVLSCLSVIDAGNAYLFRWRKFIYEGRCVCGIDGREGRTIRP